MILFYVGLKTEIESFNFVQRTVLALVREKGRGGVRGRWSWVAWHSFETTEGVLVPNGGGLVHLFRRHFVGVINGLVTLISSGSNRVVT